VLAAAVVRARREMRVGMFFLTFKTLVRVASHYSKGLFSRRECYGFTMIDHMLSRRIQLAHGF
jgi:hypothetical protein